MSTGGDQKQGENQQEQEQVFRFGDALVTAPVLSQQRQETSVGGLLGASVTAAATQANSGLFGASALPLASIHGIHNNMLQPSTQATLQPATGAVSVVTHPVTHNLIPIHLQPYSTGGSLNGTLGHRPALIPSFQNQSPTASAAATMPAVNTTLAALSSSMTTTGFLLLSTPLDASTTVAAGNSASAVATLAAHAVATGGSIPPGLAVAASVTAPTPMPLTVQDRPLTHPVYNGVNPSYPGLRVLHNSPPIFTVENFLTPYECNFLINAAQDCFGPAPVVGKGVGEVSPSRTSSTCYLAREDLPDLMRKVTMLTGKPLEHCELPQVGRYFATQQYLQHYDAFDLSNEDGRRFASNGGQRTITVLIYLNDVSHGGATRFPALNNLDVQPRQGMALVFFPSTVDGMLDKQALHAAMPAVDTKFVSQVWIRQSNYNGHPSKRLAQTLGIPFGQEQQQQQQQPPLMNHPMLLQQ